MIVRAAALLIGLGCYGLSMAMMVRAELGLDPWDVFHQGLSRHTPMTIGVASAVVGVLVLLAWIPLRNKPGVGTVANVVVIAATVDAALVVLPAPHTVPARVALMVAAVLLNALATVLYVGPAWGPAPGRVDDGAGCAQRTLSTPGTHHHRGHRFDRGWLLGGSVGPGTVLYAFGIGPLVQLLLRFTPGAVLARSGWAPIPGCPGTSGGSRMRHDGAVPDSPDAVDPDLLIDFRKVSLRRGAGCWSARWTGRSSSTSAGS